MCDDTELLQKYVSERSEAAFAELVRRHVSLVYATALRETAGDRALAEDVGQAVFVELARKADRLLQHPILAGWLYTSVRHVSANIRRAEMRRQSREQEAQAMHESSAADSSEATWKQIRPVVDDAMHELNEADRAAVVLRFFQERSLREIGEVLGLSENAARMRVDRALEKLRLLLERRGITSTASGLTAALAAGVMAPAPPALAAAIVTAAVASPAMATSTTLTTLKIMSMTKLKSGLIGSLVVAGVALPIWQETRVRHLAADNRQLHAQAVRVPALEARLASLSKLEANDHELAQLRRDQEKMKLEVARSRNMAGAARQAESEAAQLRKELTRRQAEAGTNQNSGAMGDLMSSALAQQTKGQLARMQAKLNLTPAQAEAIQGILDRQTQVMSKSMQKVFAGKLGQEDMAELRRNPFNPEVEIKALLSADQLALYQEYKQEEALGQARLAANSELLQLQGVLGLSPEQQDQAFSALYDLTLRQLRGETTGTPSSDPVENMRGVLEQKVQALESVLTPEQVQSYRQFQETQLRFMKSVMPQSGTPSGGS